ncbi:aldo/keto reductase [uncultured Sphingomonas sp.]|uniref:aldo/keto reductase n=1 Tax=uncultured Sphingomonas sp. TaxID=158754 RepID=UPI0035CA75CD
MTPGWWRALPDGKPVSALGFGCSSLWAKPGFDEGRAQGVLAAAGEGGINHFDTAPSYGGGTGERRLGEYLRGRDASRFVVSTKVGSNLIDGAVVRGFDPVLAERSFTGSLERLGLERVDILYLHGPARSDLTDALFGWLDRLKAQGRIGLSGMESGDPALFDGFERSPLDVAMLHYNVGDPSTGARIAALAAAGKTVMSGTVLAQGKFALRTFLPRDRRSLWYLLRQAKNDPWFWWRGPRLARALAATGRTPHDAAIGFVVGHPAITSGLFGSTDPGHVLANAAAGHHPLDARARSALGGA